MSNSSMDLQVALADLNASRARLREVLLPPPPDPNAPRSKGIFSGVVDGAASAWNWLKGTMGGSPAVSVALEAVQHWWSTHPWRQLGSTVAVPLGVAALPLVRRHPWAAVIGASVAGALFIKARPWRWRLVSQQAHAVRRQAVRWALAQATKPAVQALVATAIASMMSNLKQTRSSSTPATRAAAAASTAPSVPSRTSVPVVPSVSSAADDMTRGRSATTGPDHVLP